MFRTSKVHKLQQSLSSKRVLDQVMQQQAKTLRKKQDDKSGKLAILHICLASIQRTEINLSALFQTTFLNLKTFAASATARLIIMALRNRTENAWF